MWSRLIAVLIVFVVSASLTADEPWRITVRLGPNVVERPYTGRVYLFFTNRPNVEPRKVFRFAQSEPIIAIDVNRWMPTEAIEFPPTDATSLLAFPTTFRNSDWTGLSVQAVVKTNPYDASMGAGSAAGEGNAYSNVVQLGADRPRHVELNVTDVAPIFPVIESPLRKRFEVRSTLLSAFHQRDVSIHAAVVLPPSYVRQADRRYPVIMDIPSFGGTHHYPRKRTVDNQRGVEFILVELDASCPLGHHAFADSDNNGPWSRAFVEEFVPALDREFRTVAESRARFVTGISSGGWSALWLQITHPDFFNGCWSCAPDPVDFRDFQTIDLDQAGLNLFHDEHGIDRRVNRTGTLTFRQLSQLESVLGPGGQLHSFEAVFGPRAPSGQPASMWNRNTGAIDPTITRAWKRFDISKILEDRWTTLGPKLRGKLHIHCDERDSFFLDGAVVRLKKTLERIGSDAIVQIHSGEGHGAFFTEAFERRIAAEMADRFNDISRVRNSMGE